LFLYPGWPGQWSSYLCHLCSHVPPCPLFYWLRWGLTNFLSELAFNHDPPDCHLLARITDMSQGTQLDLFWDGRAKSIHSDESYKHPEIWKWGIRDSFFSSGEWVSKTPVCSVDVEMLKGAGIPWGPGRRSPWGERLLGHHIHIHRHAVAFVTLTSGLTTST
jgi:hypothetical protein